jgi:ornithine cyclodeaminase/alanine dehydrogenase-like protein (mu-crystallin family)
MPVDSLSETDVRERLDALQLIDAIEAAFRERYPHVTIPERPNAALGYGSFLAMSCYDRSRHALGIKLIMVRDQPVRDQAPPGALPGGGRVHASYLLLDPETAEPQLVIAANYLTGLRTAATSAVATKFLARPDVSTLGIFGTGRLARAHLVALPLVRKFERVLVCGRTPGRSEEFVQQMASETAGLTLAVADARTCAAESDVLCTCTASTSPLFDGRDLRQGTHLNLVGAYQPHTREADTVTIQRSRVIVDTYAGAKTEMGVLLIPLQEGAIEDDHVVSDLHELVSGKRQGRRAREEITVFNSVGCALEDLAAAELLLAARP